MKKGSEKMSTEIKTDLTKVSNKAYNDFAKPTATGIKFIKDFLVSGVKPFMYRKIKESEYRIQQINDELERKCNAIPIENQTEPRISILGPAIDMIKYNLEEEHIKELFINVLVSEMDDKKQNKVLPAYVEIIKQISKEDAGFISFISEVNGIIENISLLQLFDKNKKELLNSDVDYYVVIEANKDFYYKKISRLSLDNLERLGIIKFNTDFGLTDISGEIENNFKVISGNNYKNKIMDYKLYSLEITDLGFNFIDICCS